MDKDTLLNMRTHLANQFVTEFADECGVLQAQALAPGADIDALRAKLKTRYERSLKKIQETYEAPQVKVERLHRAVFNQWRPE